MVRNFLYLMYLDDIIHVWFIFVHVWFIFVHVWFIFVHIWFINRTYSVVSSFISVISSFLDVISSYIYGYLRTWSGIIVHTAVYHRYYWGWVICFYPDIIVYIRLSSFLLRLSCFILRLSCFILRWSCFILRYSSFLLRLSSLVPWRIIMHITVYHCFSYGCPRTCTVIFWHITCWLYRNQISVIDGVSRRMNIYFRSDEDTAII